jgi:hypothetical protein
MRCKRGQYNKGHCFDNCDHFSANILPIVFSARIGVSISSQESHFPPKIVAKMYTKP